jgi:hypothetical protein
VRQPIRKNTETLRRAWIDYVYTHLMCPRVQLGIDLSTMVLRLRALHQARSDSERARESVIITRVDLMSCEDRHQGM